MGACTPACKNTKVRVKNKCIFLQYLYAELKYDIINNIGIKN